MGQQQEPPELSPEAAELEEKLQKLRKSGGVELGEPIEVFYSEAAGDANLFGLSYAKALADADVKASVASKIGGAPLPLAAAPVWPNAPLGVTVSKFVPCATLTVSIARPGLAVSAAAVAVDFPAANAEVGGAQYASVDDEVGGTCGALPSGGGAEALGSKAEGGCP